MMDQQIKTWQLMPSNIPKILNVDIYNNNKSTVVFLNLNYIV